MAKKADPKVKTTVTGGSCVLFFSDRAVVCPLCGVLVPKATSHRCEQGDDGRRTS